MRASFELLTPRSTDELIDRRPLFATRRTRCAVRVGVCVGMGMNSGERRGWGLDARCGRSGRSRSRASTCMRSRCAGTRRGAGAESGDDVDGGEEGARAGTRCGVGCEMRRLLLRVLGADVILQTMLTVDGLRVHTCTVSTMPPCACPMCSGCTNPSVSTNHGNHQGECDELGPREA